MTLLTVHKSIAKDSCIVALRLVVGHDTRVSGTQRMYELLLRSYHCLDLLGHRSPAFRTHAWTPTEWMLIADFEAVLRWMCGLSIEVHAC